MSSVPNTSKPSSGISRAERRKKWMQQRKKGTREGLRDRSSIPNNKTTNSVETQVPVITIKNKGGFRTSELTEKFVVRKSSQLHDNRSQSKSNKNNKINKGIKKKNKINSTNNKVKEKKNSNVNTDVTETSTTMTTSVNLSTTMTTSVNLSPSKHIPHKYILFIGNLPSTITKEQLEEHFRKTGGVKTVRIPKEKGTDKSRGFAYIEFKDRISHGIALRLHHTTLDGKKINVEFTSAGSGKSKKRKEKLKQKNNALAKMKIPYGAS